jgi:hypothetical protein
MMTVDLSLTCRKNDCGGMGRTEAPKPGQVVSHHFLWAEERATRLVEGRKARPCVVLAVVTAGFFKQIREAVLTVAAAGCRRLIATFDRDYSDGEFDEVRITVTVHSIAFQKTAGLD